jgi:hypothetical protein
MMPSLPTEKHDVYCGVDPGFSGAFGSISADGKIVGVYPMPVKVLGKNSTYRGLNLEELSGICRQLCSYDDIVFGLENPTTRPGEGAERSFRFGRQLGVLETFLFKTDRAYYLISPSLWKGRLGLPGKEHDPHSEAGAKLWDSFYPNHRHLIRGPRGGILNGPLDALLIAHFLRIQGNGIADVARQHGKDSIQMMAMMLSGGRKKRGRLPNFKVDTAA